VYLDLDLAMAFDLHTCVVEGPSELRRLLILRITDINALI
jgi:hypothetical protein